MKVTTSVSIGTVSVVQEHSAYFGGSSEFSEAMSVVAFGSMNTKTLHESSA